MLDRDFQIIRKIYDEIDIMNMLIFEMDKEFFLTDERTKRAVSMTLINIGELVKNLSEDIKLKNSNIPWRAIAGMRDIAAHKYQTVSMDDVWLTISNDIPVFHMEISKIIES